MTVVRTLHGAGNAPGIVPLPRDAPVDALEADAWVVRGRLILQHDRPVGAYRVALHERGLRLRPRPGTLEGLLRAAEGRAISLDVRAWWRDPTPDVFRVLSAFDADTRASIRFTCESWSLAERLRAWVPDIAAGYSVRSELQLRRFIEGRIAGEIPEVPVSVRHTLLRAADEVQALRRFSPRVTVWTVDDIARARELAGWGADEVVSNRLEVLAAL